MKTEARKIMGLGEKVALMTRGAQESGRGIARKFGHHGTALVTEDLHCSRVDAEERLI